IIAPLHAPRYRHFCSDLFPPEFCAFPLSVWCRRSNASRQLVAVLTQLDEEVYSTKGKWFLETGFCC
ncbi:MAG: hypothetical protein E5V24_06025, partial [Mesorhizobium sp.]